MAASGCRTSFVGDVNILELAEIVAQSSRYTHTQKKTPLNYIL